jgi:3-oxoacyl-(acyl-carrier-protein) synthase
MRRAHVSDAQNRRSEKDQIPKDAMLQIIKFGIQSTAENRSDEQRKEESQRSKTRVKMCIGSSTEQMPVVMFSHKQSLLQIGSGVSSFYTTTTTITLQRLVRIR